MSAGDRSISAMVRVCNEEEFLREAIRSIVDIVDEIVLVDNASNDGTPEVVHALKADYPGLMRTYEYPHAITRVGRETWELSERDPDGRSPCLSSSYYNFCLEQCTRPYVLKWDGDMVAVDEFQQHVADWRSSGRPVMVFHGANVHPDRRHLIAARTADREALISKLEVPGLPQWATSLSHDYPEPRLFRRQGARYETTLLWTQHLSTPLSGGGSRSTDRFVVETPCYLHLKFCKRDPLSNYSPDLAEVIRTNITVGRKLRPAELAILRRRKLRW